MRSLKAFIPASMGISALALLAPSAMPLTVTAAQVSPPGVDLAVVRAAAAPVTNTPAVAPLSGGVDAGGVKCLVKWFDPEVLGTQGSRWNERDFDTIVFVQAKLICNDTIGTSELLIEQNDQLAVAQTVVNNQSDVSLHSFTVKLNDEQEDALCAAVARSGSSGSFGVVAQECWHGLGFHGKFPFPANAR